MDLYTVIKLIILSLVAGLATFIGVFIGSCRDFGKKGLVFGTSFAAGIMILISAFELIPGSVKESNLTNALVFLIAGFVVVWLLNLVIPHLHSVKNLEDCDDKYLMKMSYLLAFGLILHDFPEGFAIASSYAYSVSLGLLVVFGLFIHNIPEGYTLSVASSRFRNKKFNYKSAFFSTLSTTFGTILGIILIGSFGALGSIFNAIAAGAMIFISLHELIPTAIKYKDNKTLVAGFVASILIYVVLGLLI